MSMYVILETLYTSGVCKNASKLFEGGGEIWINIPAQGLKSGVFD